MSHLRRIPFVLVIACFAVASTVARAADAPATRPAEPDAKLDACTSQLQEICRALAAYERDHH